MSCSDYRYYEINATRRKVLTPLQERYYVELDIPGIVADLSNSDYFCFEMSKKIPLNDGSFCWALKVLGGLSQEDRGALSVGNGFLDQDEAWYNDMVRGGSRVLINFSKNPKA